MKTKNSANEIESDAFVFQYKQQKKKFEKKY